MKLASPSLKTTKHAAVKNKRGDWKQTQSALEAASGASICSCLVVLLSLLLILECGNCSVSAFVPCGSRHSSSSRSSSSTTITTTSSLQLRASKLGFLSFDLDDTLFPTNEVVNVANAVMIARMQELGVPSTEADFLDTTRAIRKQLDQPMTYSTLRKLAIAQEFAKYTAVTKKISENRNDLVEECFNVWLDERHAAAERYLFNDAIEMLSTVKEAFPDICIAAITNGRGNPLDMSNTLAEFFDFCVSGEDDNVHPNRKPHPGIFEESLRRYNSLYPHHREGDDRIWCHVGDCLANDVGASAEVGAQAIWLCPPEHDADAVASEIATLSSTPKWSTATKADQKKRAQLVREAQEKVSVRISSLSELPRAIEDMIVNVASVGAGSAAE